MKSQDIPEGLGSSLSSKVASGWKESESQQKVHFIPIPGYQPATCAL